MITIESTRIHEAGHALLLISAGHPQVRLGEIHTIRSDDAAGGCGIEPWWDVREEGWPQWFYPAPDREAEAALALVAFGGKVAETVVLGRHPTRGWYNDILTAGLRIALLGNASRSFVKAISARLEEARDNQDLSDALIHRLKSATATNSGLEFGPAFVALEAEALRRITASVPAINALADALAQNERLSGAEVLKILEGSTWCGVLGVPTIPGVPST